MITLSGCSILSRQNPATSGEDTAFLTPIPVQTLEAYKSDLPIRDKLQAVIAARVNLGSTRLHFIVAPNVVSVEEINLGEAHKRSEQSGVYEYTNRPSDTQVWLVIFEGDYQVIPPDPEHTLTPSPPTHGCIYVIIEAIEEWRTEIGTIECTPQ